MKCTHVYIINKKLSTKTNVNIKNKDSLILKRIFLLKRHFAY